MSALRTMRLGLAAAFGFSVALLTGCGGGHSHIEGTVTLDGQPVDGGTISFIPAGQGSAMGGQITNGKYSFESPGTVVPGTYKVEINWLKKTGKTVQNKNDPGTTMDETKQAIPMEYNSQTKLTADLKSGSNVNNFELKSGGAIDTRPVGAPPPKSKAVGDS